MTDTACSLADLLIPLDKPGRPWENWPYPLVSWWDMEKFSTGPLYAIAKMFGQMQIMFAQYQKDASKNKGVTFLPAGVKHILRKNLRQIRMYCVKLDLKVAIACIDDALLDLKSELFLPERLDRIYTDLDNSIRRDMQAVLFFHVPFNLREFYKPKALFGPMVADRFPCAAYDIEEAGTCYTFGRSTACVFHLMRVMETGVRRFGQIMGVSFPEDKEWGKILKIASGKIEQEKDARPLHGRDPEIVVWYGIHQHLTAVCIGCRNQFMHPKATCTMEEAKDLISLVGSFMRALAKRTPPVIPGPSTTQ
ncbi:MAG: hypothetical protein ABR865_06205 [Terracidiphilus sp.]|jgi:hypothetical protein